MKKLIILLVGLFSLDVFALVNTQNLNLFYKKQDVYFGCFGFPLEIERSYNSQSTILSGFGKGWTYNYNVRLQDREGYIRVFEADGFLASYIPLKYSDRYREQNINEIIKRIIAEEKKANKLRKKEEYKELSALLARDYDQYESMRNRYLITSGKTLPGKYVSTARGISELVKTSKGYVRTSILGTKEYFDRDGRFIELRDAYDNIVSFKYFTDKTVVTDACKRPLTINLDKDRQILSLLDHTGRSLKYNYDNDGQLDSVTDFDGSKTTYKYDDEKRLAGIIFPQKDKNTKAESVRIIYGEYNRVEEIQGPGNKVTTYKRTVDPKNKRHTITVIRDNESKWEQFDYLDDEHKTVRTYKDGTKETTLLHAATGRPTKYTSQKGEVTYHEYDNSGNRIRTTNPDGDIIEYGFDDKNRMNAVTLSNGQKISYTFNQYGDVTEAKLVDIKDPKKSILKKLSITWDKRGKKRLLDDSKGNRISMRYDSYGNMSELEKVGVGKLVYSFDSLGNETSHQFVKDKKYKDELTIEDLKRIISLSLAELMSLLQY